MMPRKKRRTLIITIIAIIILIIAIIIALLYLNTDMFKSNQTLFLKYVGKNTENLKSMGEIFNKTEYDSLLENNKCTKKTEIQVNYTKNIGTTSEDTSNSINKLKLTIDGQEDSINNYDYKNIQLLNDNEQIMRTEYIQNDNVYGIRFSDLFKQYILIENGDLKDLFRKMGYSDEKIENIPDTIDTNQDILGALQFNDAEIENLQEKYLSLIEQSFSKENFAKQSGQIVLINQKKIECNAYILKVTKEQLNDMYVKILENLKQDEVILEKIENLQNEINKLSIDSSNTINLKEDIINKLETVIDEINKNNIGNEENKIIVYESGGDTVRTTIQSTDYELNFDCLQIDGEKFGEFTVMQNENQKSQITLKSKESEIVFSIKNNEKDKPVRIDFTQDTKIEGNSCNKNILIQYEDENNRIEANIMQDTNLVNQFENQITLNDENSIQLNTMEEQEVQNVLNLVNTELEKKWNSVSEKIKISDIQEILQTIGIIQDNQSFEGTGVSETEKNRFNSKFELLQGENVTGENVLKVIDAIKDNFINMEMVSNQELKLEINRTQNNEEMAEILKAFVEKDKNRKYNIGIEYDEMGLVKYVILTIVKTQ